MSLYEPGSGVWGAWPPSWLCTWLRTFRVAVDLEGDAVRAAFCPHVSSYVGIGKLPLR